MMVMVASGCGGDEDQDGVAAAAATCESACANLTVVCSEDWDGQSDCVGECEEDSQGRDDACLVSLYDCIGSLSTCDPQSCGTVANCPSGDQ